MSSIFATYKRLKFTLMSCDLTWDTEKSKKIMKPHGAWKDDAKRQCKPKSSGYGLLTGAKYGCVGIDLDDLNEPVQQKLMKMMWMCNAIQKTRKGRHYLFKYDARLKQTANAKYKIDIRGDNGLLFVEPSAYKIDENETVQYTWECLPEDGEELAQCPEEVVAYLTELGVIGREVVSQVPSDTPLDIPLARIQAKDQETLVAVIIGLDAIKRNHYDCWVRIGMICFNEGLGVGPWCDFSAQSPKFREGECERVWTSFRKGSLTQATLWKWLKEDNPERFKELQPRRQDFWKIMRDANQDDVAKAFFNMKPDNYLWSERTGWYVLQPNNTWVRTEKMPHGLLTDIADTLKAVASEHKDALDMSKEESKELFKTARNFYIKVGTAQYIEGAIKFLGSLYNCVELEKKIDENRMLFAFTDCVVDLTTGDTRPIQPKDLIATTTGFAKPKEMSESGNNEMRAFIMSIWEDTETVAYVIKTLAYSLTGIKNFEEFYTWTGIGRNGKGALSLLVEKAFGNYFGTININTFTKPTEGNDKPMPALVDARGKRILMTTEPATDDKLQIDLIKTITGNDAVNVRTLYSKDIVSYVPSYTLIIQTNGVPSPSRPDQAFNARHRIVPFPFKFVDVPVEDFERVGNPNLKQEIAGWRDDFILLLLDIYQTEVKGTRGIAIPETVKDQTAEYEDLNNPLKEWLRAYYVITKKEEDYVVASDMYNTFRADTGKEMSSVKFSAMMTLNNVVKKKRSNVRYVGIRRREVESLLE